MPAARQADHDIQLMQVTAPRSLAAEVADRIAVRVREVPPRTRLGTKAELRRQTGVAAATLNEALRMLQARGLVSLRTGPKGGVFAERPDPYVRMGQAMLWVGDGRLDLPDAVAVRNALDALTVVEAAQHRTATDLERLHARMRVVGESVHDDLALARAIWDFHRAIYRSGENTILSSVCLAVMDIIAEQVRDVVPKSLEHRQARVAVHQGLLEAIEAQDLQACADASREHDTEMTGFPPR